MLVTISMKRILVLISLSLAQYSFGQIENYEDTLNSSVLWTPFLVTGSNISYHIFDETDTVFFKLEDLGFQFSNGTFTKDTSHIVCIDMMSNIEKGHNRCVILKNGTPFTGYFKRRLVHKDSTYSIFSGHLKNGLIETGSFIEFYHNGIIKQTGQYQNNWKSAIWTYYYPDGKIEWLTKYIEGADYPVIEFEYDTSGSLIYFNDEESIMKKMIKEFNKKQ